MPDAAGKIKGISLSGKAGEAWERIRDDAIKAAHEFEEQMERTRQMAREPAGGVKRLADEVRALAE